MSIKEDIIAEEAQERKEEPYHEWVKENLNYLQEEFSSELSDEFASFCKERYNKETGDDQ